MSQHDYYVNSLENDETLTVTYTKRKAGYVSATSNTEVSFFMILCFVGLLVVVFLKTTAHEPSTQQPTEQTSTQQPAPVH